MLVALSDPVLVSVIGGAFGILSLAVAAVLQKVTASTKAAVEQNTARLTVAGEGWERIVQGYEDEIRNLRHAVDSERTLSAHFATLAESRQTELTELRLQIVKDRNG